MTTDYQRVKSIFESIVDLPRDKWDSALDEHCAADAELRKAVKNLLSSHEDAGDFLGAPTLHPGSLVTRGGSAINSSIQTITVDGYTPLDILGEGGFGTVYRAQQEYPVRRTVALKVIKAGMDTREVIARFEGERQALAMMSHPNVAAVLDAGATNEGRPYFVMEYVPGEPITTFCDRNKLSIQERLQLFTQVCGAVQHAHQKGIIHRDLKPSNVLVVSDGSDDAANSSGTRSSALVKIIDFGVAKATEQRLSDHSMMTQQGVLVGTPEYMSPEQADPDELDIDTRTDIYSLGVLLYELITGTLPFSPKTLRSKGPWEIQRIVREQEPPRPSHRLSVLCRAVSRNEEPDENAAGVFEKKESLTDIVSRRKTDAVSLMKTVRGELDWIVMKCLEKDRGRRYETANAIALEIQRFLNNEPVVAGPPGTGYRVKKFIARNRTGVVAASVVFVAILIGLSLLIVGLREATLARDVADQQRKLAQKAAEKAERSARRSEAVNKFLQDMLSKADPRISARREMSVREALDQAVAKLDSGEMESEPEIEADIRITIGRSYAGLAQFEKAETQLNKAIEILKSSGGDQTVEFADALREHGAALKLSGRPAEAEAELRAAHTIFVGLGSDFKDKAMSCESDLALTLIDQKKYDDAEIILRDVYAFATAADNKENDLLPEAVNNLGSLYMAKQDFVAAEPQFREAIEINTKRHGEIHPILATNYDNLAQALHGKGELDAAEAAFDEALKIRRKLFGDDHPDLATSLHNYAVLLFVRGNLPKCEEAIRESRSIFIKVYGLAHADSLTVTDSLVSVLGAQGKLADAEALLLEAFEAIRNDGSITDDRKHAMAFRLSQLYRALQKPDESAKWEETAARYESKAASSQPAEGD